MTDEDIVRLAQEAARTIGRVPQESLDVLAVLVETTLRYRDIMKDEAGVVVTVGDVREGLALLQESLATGRLPQAGRAVCIDLVRLWHQELRRYL